MEKKIMENGIFQSICNWQLVWCPSTNKKPWMKMNRFYWWCLVTKSKWKITHFSLAFGGASDIVETQCSTSSLNSGRLLCLTFGRNSMNYARAVQFFAMPHHIASNYVLYTAGINCNFQIGLTNAKTVFFLFSNDNFCVVVRSEKKNLLQLHRNRNGISTSNRNHGRNKKLKVNWSFGAQIILIASLGMKYRTVSARFD